MAVSVHTEGYWDRQNRAQRNKQVTVAFEGDYAVLRTAGHEQQLVARFYNRMASKIGNVEMKMFETYAGMGLDAHAPGMLGAFSLPTT